MPGNDTLVHGGGVNKDEFYTRMCDIEDELRHYRDQFRGKTILCNCDDPYESNFFKYFVLNFNHLDLKKLIATSYDPSPIAGTQLPLFDIEGLRHLPHKEPFAIEITRVPTASGDDAINLTDVEALLKQDANTARRLVGDTEYSAGDFRSSQCVDLMDEADIVVTNPPFSLFREYVSLLVQHQKQFLVIGNTNAITYKDIFMLLRSDRLRTGYTNFNVGMFFEVPDNWDHFHHFDEQTGKKLARVSTSCWYTNLDVTRHHEPLRLFRRYLPDEYPTYDNYDAIEVGKVAEIPADYAGVMGVPITFMDRYNPQQFSVLGLCASAGYDPEVVGIEKDSAFQDARPLIAGRNTYARIFIRRKDQL